MGAYLTLLVSKDVSQEEWDPIFKESVKMLDTFPLAMEKTKVIKGYPFNCLVKAEYKEGSDHWETCGNYDYMDSAETQYFPRYVKCYDGVAPDVKDPLIKRYDYRIDNSFYVFGNKIQMCSYGLYLLAIAMMVEHRLPSRTYTYGDIYNPQIERAVEVANSVLDYNISLPDNFSVEKLFKRINDFPIPENDKLKLLNSEARFLLTEEEWRFIEKNFSKEVIDSVYKTKPDFASMEQ